MKISTILKTVALALAATALACAAPTDTKTDPKTTTTPVLQVQFNYSTTADTTTTKPNMTFMLKSSAEAKVISSVTATVAVNAAAFQGGLNAVSLGAKTYGWTWISGSSETSITAANTWTDLTWTAPATTGLLEFYFFSTAGTTASNVTTGQIYVKKVTLTYSDGTTETVAFTNSSDPDSGRYQVWTKNSNDTTDQNAGITSWSSALGSVSF